MTNEIYTLTTFRRIIKLVARLMDVAFPGKDVTVGVLEGRSLFTDPWFIVVKHPGYPEVRVKLDPTVIIDQVDHGGNVDASEYALGVFEGVIERLAASAPDPAGFVSTVRKDMMVEFSRMGIGGENDGV